jgi:hypothetical protein
MALKNPSSLADPFAFMPPREHSKLKFAPGLADIIEKKAAEVVGKFGGPCRGRTYGPLIKRCPIDQTQQIQEHVSEQKNKESK